MPAQKKGNQRQGQGEGEEERTESSLVSPVPPELSGEAPPGPQSSSCGFNGALGVTGDDQQTIFILMNVRGK